MAIKDDIKTLLENSYELSRGEIIKKLGIDREQARKPITRLLEAKEIERRVDENGVEWFCAGDVGTAVPRKEEIIGSFERGIEVQFERAVAGYEQCVEPSQGSHVEEVAGFSVKWNNDDFTRGYKAGIKAERVEIERAIGKKVLELLGVGEEA